MSQVGEAHKMMMRHMGWALKELKHLELAVKDEDQQFELGVAIKHLENAYVMAEHIDSGTMYDP